MKGKLNMEWDKLSASAFPRAVRAARGVCVFPVGCIEKHGDHLPLGADALMAYRLACAAAAREPAVVFPYFFLSSIIEARHQPGTVALRHDLLLPLFEHLCDEIGRNGFDKILILNFHGGNQGLFSFFGRLFQEKRKPYVVYFANGWTCTSAKDAGHAGELETSVLTHLFPEAVAAAAATEDGRPRGRLRHLAAAGLSTGTDWYADFPNHLHTDGTPGSAAKGRRFFDEMVARLELQVRVIKRDRAAARIFDEFHRRAAAPVHQRKTAGGRA